MNTNLTRKEESVNTVRAILKGIPYVGETLDQFIFGRLDELRFKCFESTLTEIAEMLKESKRAPRVDSEQFIELLEAVTPGLVRATRNEKRERFRDLLLNAATLPPDSAEWEKAKLAGQLLAELEAPALAVLASLAHYAGAQPASIVSLPRPQVVNQESFSSDSPAPEPLVIDFDSSVVEEWMWRLKEKRLIGFQSKGAPGSFGGVYLTELGKMLVEWTVGERSAT